MPRTTADLVRRRLANQKLASSTLRTPAGIDVHVTPHRSLGAAERKTVADAAERYSGFLGRTVHTAIRPTAG